MLSRVRPGSDFLALTLLLFLVLSFLGRTGLLADLLPSFAVEIMPGTQSCSTLLINLLLLFLTTYACDFYIHFSFVFTCTFDFWSVY